MAKSAFKLASMSVDALLQLRDEIDTTVIEGDSLSRIVIVEFPSIERFRSFYNAPEYQEAKALRQSATRGNMFVVEGA